MGTRDPRVDAYVESAADFAKPILEHLRAVVHAACPDAVETIKWGHPQFEYKGPFCGMAAFKAHAAFGFWKHALVVPEDDGRSKEAMGGFGRLTTVKDLPPKSKLVAYVKKAMELNDKGIKVVRSKTGPKKPVPVAEGALGRAREAPEGPRDLGRVQPEPPPRVRGVDRRGEGRRHEGASPRHDARVARGGQEAELEVREVLTGPAAPGARASDRIR